MTSKITLQLSVLIVAVTIAFGTLLTTAFAHEGEVHEASSVDTPQIANMKQMVTLLTQVVDLLKQKAVVAVSTATEDYHSSQNDEGEELKIWVEVHSNITHAHIQRLHEAIEEFFVDAVHTDHAAVVAAIAKKTGMTAHDIEEIITYPEGALDAKGDSAHHDEEQDESGIHIMATGTIMWGDGTEVFGATITADGKIKLADGDIITPAFDLR